MWPFAGLVCAAAVGLSIVLRAGSRGSIRRDRFPWLLDEVSKLHVTIVASLAGFAFTGVVLVVTLAQDKARAAEARLDTVIAMFLVAYLFWVGSAFLISYVPHAGATGDLVQRVHFSLASTIEYRTVFLSWFALLPLLQANGLGRLVPVLYLLLPASLVVGSVILAMATDGLGLLPLKETYLSVAVATGLVLAYGAFAWAVPGVRSVYSAESLTVALFFLNSAGFALAALTPLSPRYAGLERFFERRARQIVIADMQLTMLTLVFLWLAVVGAA